jgi:ribonuclease P protein component
VLPAVHRLNDADVFRQAARKGRRASSRTLVVHLLKADAGSGVPAVQVGFVVSKAVGNSVVRNRVKRRLRPLVREQIPGLAGAEALVVRALPSSATATSAELRGDLGRCLEGVR